MSGFSVAGKRVVVVGGSRSGVAAAELLVARGAAVLLTDLKEHLPDEARLRAAGVALELGGHRADTLARADLVVLSPGVPPDQPAVQAARAAGVRTIAEIELASRWLKGRIVAVTGTKGKSTTTTLIERILAEGGVNVSAGGNLGPALSLQVADSTADAVHVVEVSSFQLEGIETFRPWIAVMLNFSPDHLDRHPGMEAYAAAKARIFSNQDESDWAVVNADDAGAIGLARDAKARRRWFALESPIEEGVTVSAGQVVERTPAGDVPLLPVSAVRLIGRHLLGDVLAATAVARLVGVAPAPIAAAVGAFTGLEHALEPVAEIAGVRFVNDSKATNVAATCKSIESFAAGLVPIMGGRYKGGDFRQLRGVVSGRVRAAVVIGESRAIIRDALGDIVPVRDAASMAEAVRAAFAEAGAGGTVLLAPGCSSFDMFTDYAERGRAFKQEVARLAEERRHDREQ
jgi:UDP-N-acetylmuramoylalanine--D-glutamate ligase